MRRTEISHPWYMKPWAFLFTLAVACQRKDSKYRQAAELSKAEEELAKYREHLEELIWTKEERSSFMSAERASVFHYLSERS